MHSVHRTHPLETVMQDYVLVALLDERDRVLMGKMNTERVAANGTSHPWGFPGGTRRKGERLVQTGRRELREETPFVLKSSRLVQLGVKVGGDWKELPRRYYLYGTHLAPREFREEFPNHPEFIEFRWFRIAEIPWHETRPGARDWFEPILRQFAKAAPTA